MSEKGGGLFQPGMIALALSTAAVAHEPEKWPQAFNARWECISTLAAGTSGTTNRLKAN